MNFEDSLKNKKTNKKPEAKTSTTKVTQLTNNFYVDYMLKL